MTPELAICVVTAGRHGALERLLASIHGQVDAPPTEVIVLANGDPGATVIARRWAGVQVLQSAPVRLGVARNMLVAHARAPMVVFLDDDVVLPETYLSNLFAQAASHPDAAGFAGPNLTPAGSSPVERAQGAVLGSWFGAGPFRHRYRLAARRTTVTGAATLCNLAVRRHWLPRFSSAVETSGEETLLLTEIARAGGRVIADPSLAVYHARRPTLEEFRRQAVRYGHGRAVATRLELRCIAPVVAALAPALAGVACAALAVAGLGSGAWTAASSLAALLVPLYSVLLVVSSLRLGRAVQLRPALVALTTLALHHGYLVGLAKALLSTHRDQHSQPATLDPAAVAPATAST